MTDKASGSSGQQKTHTATRVNPDTGQTEIKEFTQEQWRNRNKSEGWTRPDDEGDESTTGTTSST